LLEFWREVERKTGIPVNYRERVEDVVRDGDGFIVKTAADLLDSVRRVRKNRALYLE
jgi:hypothetical protein